MSARFVKQPKKRGRDFQLNLDIFWLKDAVTRVKERPGLPSLEDSANLRDPGVLALAVTQPQARPGFPITEDLEAALAQFAEIATDLNSDAPIDHIRTHFPRAAHRRLSWAMGGRQ